LSLEQRIDKLDTVLVLLEKKLDSVPSELFHSQPAAIYNEVSTQPEVSSQQQVSNQPGSQPETQNLEPAQQEAQVPPEEDPDRGIV